MRKSRDPGGRPDGDALSAGEVEPGLVVDVRNRFDRSWSSGFEVVETVVGAGGEWRCRVRLVGGGALLPVWFSADDVSLPREHPSKLARPARANVPARLRVPSTTAGRRPASARDLAVLRGDDGGSNDDVSGGSLQHLDDGDPEADGRDLRADERDREAERRDVAAEDRDLGAPGPSTESGQDGLAVLRRQSAADRLAAADDRDHNRLDREQAARDRHDANEQRAVAARDILTGLWRRDVGLTELAHEVDRSRRSGEPLTIVFLDVDGLKRINDDRGHAAGDTALRAVADALRAAMRSYDLIVRYGGDEFLSAAAGMGTAELSSRMLRVGTQLAALPEPVSVSFGLAELQSDDRVETVVARADTALYDQRRRRLVGRAGEPPGPTPR